MKAVRFHEHGGPEVLRYEEAPDPEVAAHEILVRVRACALNHLDLWVRKGVARACGSRGFSRRSCAHSPTMRNGVVMQ